MDLWGKLAAHIEGEVLCDAFTRGRYATDASIYQIMPRGVVIPKSVSDIEASLEFARVEGMSVLPRGGGTSQCGQTVNDSLVIDNSKYFNDIIDLDVENRRCKVRPGIVLDELNRALKPHGLWFPVDVSTGSRATIGGMTANNSCGGRSLRYGTMRHNVAAISGIKADGTYARFEILAGPADPFAAELLKIGAREANEIKARFPDLLRRVGGYNLDALVPEKAPQNLAHLLVGSEGTLAYFTEIDLILSPLPEAKVMGICHFASFAAAMDATQHLVGLDPVAVELVDDTMIALARDIPAFRKTVEAAVEGVPEALLLVDFCEATPEANAAKLSDLADRMADLGFSFEARGAKWGGVRDVIDPGLQADIAEFRKAGLNIMMSMKEEGKPVSFVEDCAVALPDLADYTAGLTEIFAKHGTKGTWYAHASVGCLHVRPILNMKLDSDVKAMRAIAEECFDLVKSYKGSHSGEHGDGILRSEFHEKMFGSRIVRSFEEVKTLFDPSGLFNPGRITNPPRLDDKSLFRFGPNYAPSDIETVFNWSEWPGASGGFQGAVEMCNNNGACRKLKGGVMCPSFRVTRDERDVVRGRANSLRLAISGQLGSGALASEQMVDAMALCVSCKACKNECPTGVDMAKMKIEVLAARRRERGLSLGDKLIGFLPRYADKAARFAGPLNVAPRLPGAGWVLEKLTGFSRSRALPNWSRHPFKDHEFQSQNPDVVLFADIFNRYFQPENLRAAARVLEHAGLEVHVATAAKGVLDCGRTYLSVGAIEEARNSAEDLLDALVPFAHKNIPIVGLEPSSLLTLRDEIPAMIASENARLVAQHTQMFEEFVASHAKLNELAFGPLDRPVVLHGHCHQKAAGEMGWVQKTLQLIPDIDLKVIETSCCGMAGAFGYKASTEAISRKMGELTLFPMVRENPDALIAADGFSCRHQILDGTGREALHVARILEMALPTKGDTP